MKVNTSYIKYALWFFVMLFVATAIVFYLKYGYVYKQPPVENVKGFIKIGRKYKLFVDTKKLRSENLALVQNALEEYSTTLTPVQVEWYEFSLQSLPINTFILDNAMQVKERSKKAVTFEKEGLFYMATQMRYVTYQGWVINTSSANYNAVVRALSYIKFPDMFMLKTGKDYDCLALEGKCVHITPAVRLAYIDKGINHATLYMMLVENIQVNKKGMLKTDTNLANLYLQFINNGGIKYTNLVTVKKGSYVCNECTCDFGTQLDPEVVVFRTLSVKDYDMIYYFIPTKIQANALQGYLLPFYKVYLEGSAKYNNTDYDVQLELFIPTFKYE